MYIKQVRKEDFCIIESGSNGKLIFFDENHQPLPSYPTELLTRNCPLKAPFVVHLELTRRCGLNCKHCYISAGKPRKNELKTNEWKIILDQLRELEVLAVYFTGGDPLLHEGCLELLAYAKNLGLSCNLLTNGLELEKNITLKNIPKEVFLVMSYDGIKGTSILRRIPGERILDIVKILRKNDRAFAVQGVVFKDNLSEMIETMEWSLKNGIDFCTNGLYPIGRAERYKDLLLKEDQFSEILALEEISNRYQENIVFSRPSYPFANPDIYQSIENIVRATKRPEPGLFVSYINSNGLLFADNYYAGENWGSEYNLRQSKFSDIWSMAFSRERKVRLTDNSGCNNCTLKENQGFCDLQNMAMSQKLHGTSSHYLFNIDRSMCKSGFMSIHPT